jgi:RimJ/RimL family protein N-acetyltransferase
MNFSLRPWNENDVESLVKYANNIHISSRLTNKFPHPYTTEHARWFIQFANANEPKHVMAIDIEGEACGGIGVHPQDDIQCKNAELGYWLGEPFWNQGVITTAILQMIDYGFNSFDINRIFARPFGSNIASQKVLEKTGFTLEAKLEKTLFKNDVYEDELIYGIRKAT